MLNEIHPATLASTQSPDQSRSTEEMNKFYARTGGFRPSDVKNFYGEEIQVVQFCSGHSVQVNKAQGEAEPCE